MGVHTEARRGRQNAQSWSSCDSLNVGAGNQTPGLCKSIRNWTTEPSLQPFWLNPDVCSDLTISKPHKIAISQRGYTFIFHAQCIGREESPAKLRDGKHILLGRRKIRKQKQNNNEENNQHPTPARQSEAGAAAHEAARTATKLSRSLMNIVKMMCVIVNVTEANRVVSVIGSTHGGFCVSARKQAARNTRLGKAQNCLT